MQNPHAKLPPKQQAVLAMIKAEPTLSYREVAQRLGVNDSTAQEYFNALKKKGVIKRIGPAKGGYWEVFNNE